MHTRRQLAVLGSLVLLSSCTHATPDRPKTQPSWSNPAHRDASKPIEQRVEDVVKRLTLEEKIALVHGDTLFTTAAIARLGIPAQSLSDGPHGVREELGPHFRPADRTDDYATWLPVGIALAATFNPDLARQYGGVIGREARARGKTMMLGPGLNVQRTPLNGRNFEYFGEDPVLISRMVVPWIQGMQSEQTAACAKHFALNNQELERDTISVEVDERALREIYLPGFEAAVKEGGVLAVMGAYNRFRGQHACQSDYLLNGILKKEWGFKGSVVSDWGGVHDTLETALHGLDLEMGTHKDNDEYFFARPLHSLVAKGVVPTAVLDDKVRRNLRVLFATNTVDGRKPGSINTNAHQETARRIAEEAIVLLKNEGSLLPLDASKLRSIAVIGENATRKQAPGGGSSTIKALYEVTPLEGVVRRVGEGTNVIVSRGYRAQGARDSELLESAVDAAKRADVAVVVGGLNHDSFMDAEGTDRKDLDLPGGQAELIRRVAEANPRTIVVLVDGGPVDMQPWLGRVRAVLQAWYGGMEGGNALSAVLFGDTNPSGKLPCSFPKRLQDSPAHALGAYPGRDGTVRYEEGLLVGYRWFDAKGIEPLFPFGFGLSYTTYSVTNLRLKEGKTEQGTVVTVNVDVTNSGSRAGSETLQVYVSDVECSLPRPPKELKAFQKVFLAPGERRTLEIPLDLNAFAFYDPSRKRWVAEAGEFRIQVGVSSREIRQESVYRLAATQYPAR